MRSMLPKFNFVICSIEESKDLDTLSLDELRNSLMVHEQKIVQQDVEEQALQVTITSKDSGCRRRKCKGRNSEKTEKGNRKKKWYGHYRFECRTNLKNVRGENSNFVEVIEEEEVSLLMVSQSSEQYHKSLWYLDTSCSNHLSGEKSAFSELDETFLTIVKFGDDSHLKTNLIGVGQLQENGYEVSIKHGICRILDSNLGLIAEAKMTTNKLFPLDMHNISSTNFCFSTKVNSQAWIWHYRYGHLNFGGLKMLQQKKMVMGLPNLDMLVDICEDCVIGKQSRDCFPKRKAWRAKRSSSRANQNMTPQEAWSGQQPDVQHLRVFGCIAFAHVPDQKSTKLDDKANKCVFMGVSRESKAYKMYNPIIKMVIINCDVVFDEDNFWSWEEKPNNQQLHLDLYDGDKEQ
ncbi:uncharacterized protein LOC125808229 [Solanum verrucosum]|uniref:uncharacterized protein LOC125808229 n=1 Tax=Solanum verrucosum TaxID=315347 RepID=UPI0020D02316|nr:uncharacterized protein LOC125808229 [Solanum verrucosum]